ncbi:hypothetical protein CR513_27510, partial [Mucuna pruriens]
MCDTLALAYEGTSQVKDSMISLLVHQYEFFKIEDHEIIDKMFGRFQTIINNLRSLVFLDSADHNAILRASKDLKKLPIEELLGTLSRFMR